MPCPICSGSLSVRDSRKRTYVNPNGTKQGLWIRRLVCGKCGKIHSELPDWIVPYRRYTQESIEPVIGGGDGPDGPDGSTLKRWKSWFRGRGTYLVGCLQSITVRITGKPVETPKAMPILHRVWSLVGWEAGWLSQIVRSLANSGLWRHTRSALLTE